MYLLNKKFFTIIFILLVILSLDIITKQLVHANMTYQQSITIIPNFFNLTYVRNFGSAWGIFSDLPEKIRIPLYYIIFSLAIIGLSVYLYKLPKKDYINIIAFSLILAGALGNFIDRLQIFHKGGYVIDFLDFHIFNYHWPVFNIADTSISTGILIILLFSFILKNKKFT